MTIILENEQEMRRQAALLREKLSRIDEQRKIKENAKLVGRCFKYHNTFGSGKKWWLYARVITGGYWLKSLTFQHTTRGFEVVTGESFHPSIGYIPISKSEFDRALRAFTRKLNQALEFNTK